MPKNWHLEDLIMDFYDVIEQRKSIRMFTAEMPPVDVIDRILRAARQAPTWANMQGCRYTIVTNPEKVALVQEGTGQGWAKSAPMFIIVSIAPKNSGTGKHGIQYYGVDAGICTTHLLLAIAAEGLGSTFMGIFDEDAIKTAINIPEKERVIAVLPVGYPAGSSKPTDRKPMEKICFLDEYGNPWQSPG